jgi:hypothetical protein
LEPQLFHAVVLTGHTEVLAQSSLLERLAERCDQAGAMNWLSFFLAASNFKGKNPCLVLILESGAMNSSLPGDFSFSVDDVHAAVLLFEYRVFGIPTGAFSTDDWGGFRTVVAPETEREAMSAMAAEALLRNGAQLALISYGHLPHVGSAVAPSLNLPVLWASRKRNKAMTLLLKPTLNATLATLGKSTRFNLGYYRRRLHAATQCEWIGDIRGLLTEHELDAINRASLNPIQPSELRMQYKSACTLPGGFLLGLRSAQGQWLSLIGGWRQGDVTVLYWQMNAAGYEKLSIGTAMRSYFLEHEIQRGAKKLIYYGGTPHSLGNSFVREEVTDLMVRRRSLHGAALQGVGRVLALLRPYVRINSQLVQTIGSDELTWRSAKETAPAGEPQSVRL